MIVLDASVLIAHLDDSDSYHDRASALLSEFADEALAASPISIAEVLVGPARAGQLDRATAALAQLDVAALQLDEHAPAALAMLRALTGLKLPDCCVLLVAEQARAGVATFDHRLTTVAREFGVRVHDR